MFTVTMLVVIGVYTIVVVVRSDKVFSVLEESNDKTREAITRISEETMVEEITSSMQRSTRLEAHIGNQMFTTLMNDVLAMRDFAEDLYSVPETYGYWPVDPPDPSKAGETTAQLLTEYNLNTKKPKIADEIGFMGNMVDIMIPIFNESNIDGCFITSMSGITIMVDQRPDEKFSASGKLLYPNLSKRPWFTGAVETGEVYFTDLQRDYFSDTIGITCSAPVYKDGEIVAVIGADLFLDSLERMIESSMDSTGFQYIVNSNGEIIFAPKDSPLSEDAKVTGNSSEEEDYTELGAFLYNVFEGKRDVYDVVMNDKHYYMSGALMNTVDWALISVKDKDAAMRQAYAMQNEIDSFANETQASLTRTIAGSRAALMIALLAVLTLAVNLIILVSDRISGPLKNMTEQVRAISGEDLEFEMTDEFRTNDEVEFLASSFQSLTRRMRKYIDQATADAAEKEKIRAELDVAKKIQEGSLPSVFPPFPERHEFDLYASVEPAKEVGGDFYDFYLLDEDHLALVMADVSGKSVPAALFMMASRNMLKNYTMMDFESPARILEKVNHEICIENKADMFVTVWLGILEISTGKITAANAGHEYPAIYRAGGEFTLLKDKHGFVIGGMDGVPYKEYEIDLKPGDVLFLYTDGVPEATSASEELFGTDRMLEALNTAVQSSPEEQLHAVRNAIDQFVGGAEQFDDITMLAFRYTGTKV